MKTKIIEATNITLDFPVIGSNSKSFRKKFLNLATGGKLSTDDNFVLIKALNNVSFTFYQGDIVGISGHNGSGKSSLLRVLSKIYNITSGKLDVRGSVMPMLNIDVGIDDGATGIENIYIKGWLLGLKTNEINKKIDDIVNFSELGDYINLPIRTYSSGMIMRLIFSIVTAFKRDILLMDEWLSVGDESFKDKANDRLKELMKSAKLIVLASHNKSLIDKLCNRKFCMQNGEILEN